MQLWNASPEPRNSFVLFIWKHSQNKIKQKTTNLTNKWNLNSTQKELKASLESCRKMGDKGKNNCRPGPKLWDTSFSCLFCHINRQCICSIWMYICIYVHVFMYKLIRVCHIFCGLGLEGTPGVTAPTIFHIIPFQKRT